MPVTYLLAAFGLIRDALTFVLNPWEYEKHRGPHYDHEYDVTAVAVWLKSDLVVKVALLAI